MGCSHFRPLRFRFVSYKENWLLNDLRKRYFHLLNNFSVFFFSRLESPTRQLELTAAKDINLQSRAGAIEVAALKDVRLSALDGSVSGKLDNFKYFKKYILHILKSIMSAWVLSLIYCLSLQHIFIYNFYLFLLRSPFIHTMKSCLTAAPGVRKNPYAESAYGAATTTGGATKSWPFASCLPAVRLLERQTIPGRAAFDMRRWRQHCL